MLPRGPPLQLRSQTKGGSALDWAPGSGALLGLLYLTADSL